MNKIKAIIFDMDGVIVDSEPIHEKAETEVLREFGIIVPENERDDFRGKKLADIFLDVTKKYGKGDEPIEKMIERKMEVYLAYALSELQLVAGVRDFLELLKSQKKYQYALTTSGNKIQQEKVLAKINLSGFFQAMVTAEDVRRGKPHPEPYLLTVEKLKELPENCLVIEDSENGIISAKSAGCTVCGITTTFGEERLRSAGADMIVADFIELAKILFPDIGKRK